MMFRVVGRYSKPNSDRFFSSDDRIGSKDEFTEQGSTFGRLMARSKMLAKATG
ncbi:MAG: hypothetical protein OXH03_02575 [Bacteroidetes bacterium]|nr:hypothetical protein [Bacteroidota bacterium]MDE2671288.1 hypothetical protein [Bacteroidota bacterium]